MLSRVARAWSMMSWGLSGVVSGVWARWWPVARMVRVRECRLTMWAWWVAESGMGGVVAWPGAWVSRVGRAWAGVSGGVVGVVSGVWAGWWPVARVVRVRECRLPVWA